MNIQDCKMNQNKSNKNYNYNIIIYVKELNNNKKVIKN
jgi:hypothetical protein